MLRRWVMKFVQWILLGVVLAASAASCRADVYVISVTMWQSGRKVESRGSAVCVGTLKNPVASLFVTAKHNVEDNPASVWISLNDSVGWRQCANVRMHPTEDLAMFELEGVRLKGYPVATGLRNSLPVTICGYGPVLHQQRSESFCFQGALIDDHIQGENGTHPITGDSGGAVLAESSDGRKVLAGIVHGYYSEVHLPRRTDTAGRRPKTGYVRAETIRGFIETQYGGCPTCPIYVQPQVRQPMIGIGIPTGPPEVIGVVRPAPANRYVPESKTAPDSRASGTQIVEQRIINEGVVDEAVTRYFRKNPVRNGRDGKDGRDGADGADGKPPSTDRVIQIIDAIMDARPERFRGQDGRDAAPVNVDEVAAAIVRNHREELRGAQGPAGHIGVLDDADMRALIRGWLNDPETRGWLVTQLAQDLQVQNLIRRLETLEAGARSGGSESVNGTHPADAPHTAVSHFVVVRSGASSRLDSMIARAKGRWPEIMEVSKTEIPSNVLVRTYPTMIAFSPTGSVAGMWESESEVVNVLSQIGDGRYP